MVRRVLVHESVWDEVPPVARDRVRDAMRAVGDAGRPAVMRRRLGIEPGTKFLIIEEGGGLVLKPLRPEDLEEEFASVLDRLQEAFAAAGLDRAEVERELEAHRSGTG